MPALAEQRAAEVVGETQLSPEQVLEAAEQARAVARGGGMKLALGFRDDEGMEIVIKGGAGGFALGGVQGTGSQGTIVVVAAEPGDRTEFVAKADQITTMQQKWLGFIPVSPKRMVGWRIYSAFLTAFEDELRRLDDTVAFASRAPTS